MALSPIERLRIILGVLKDGTGDKATVETVARYADSLTKQSPIPGNASPSNAEKAEHLLRLFRRFITDRHVSQRVDTDTSIAKATGRAAAEAETLTDLGE